MKKTTLLHARLSGLIASMGHGDLIVIGDAGLPVPPGVEVIDLAVIRGLPGVFDVLDAVLSELVVERAELASEASEDLAARFRSRDIGTVTTLSHDRFKANSASARAIVRTGECTPYANICLYAGVAF
ncbi:D-ribose pyranase [Paracoccus sp. 1_MG-2023]|uniref:D-ribose pyranase n=1 Tax=unclassified Paracoccus (in: a-proteobacteria) TaxID=2688777 RepID=UPI001C08BDE7|nr:MULTISPECIES: D-ribose pyranase [unclassified Paracoccus (in: a-proteobacteria)]MBU2956679.1 D-ribose pyranase [Paracoccus sp. C2R09]MDO6668784.1 D-ribose pyranase [Paracoccus sp. 1_MG-2023]